MFPEHVDSLSGTFEANRHSGPQDDSAKCHSVREAERAGREGHPQCSERVEEWKIDGSDAS